MAAVASTAVTIKRGWDEGSKSGQLIQSTRQADVVLTAQGGTANDIPASLFNLAEIYDARAVVLNSTGTLTYIALVIEADGEGILTCDEAGAIANATGTLSLVVSGRST